MLSGEHLSKMSRYELQQYAKEMGIKANQSSQKLIDELTQLSSTGEEEQKPVAAVKSRRARRLPPLHSRAHQRSHHPALAALSRRTWSCHSIVCRRSAHHQLQYITSRFATLTYLLTGPKMRQQVRSLHLFWPAAAPCTLFAIVRGVAQRLQDLVGQLEKHLREKQRALTAGPPAAARSAADVAELVTASACAHSDYSS